jgi:plasmid stabilization system protein ParE
MNAPFQLTPQAIEDLDDIWSFVAADSQEAADRVETEILTACHQLARSPRIGHKRRDITPLPVRFWTLPRYPNYVIVYRPEMQPLQVVAILHGRQDLEQRLKSRLVP